MTSSRDVPPAHETEPRETGDLLVTVNWRDRAAVLSVTGEIDLLTAPEFEDIVSGIVREGPALLVVDLRKVSFLSSAGLQVLAATHQRLGDRRLRVVSDAAVTTRPFTTTGLDEWIGLFPSLEKALTAPSGEGGKAP
ncbi:STAS domain-containing protein [Amycolatopsis sp. H20-H5]|uniref:STAS domain-containing protein n=1 Tax=Amycolatopsis sp. H20-H5 TaxID=3046309 RepID=UPI002DBFF2B1|nr:STAS domain-containing protein [Amycolatopsis sp. H20-H5]MEC3982512.1 STAS domain-containing protein [Amycolatopsis sp. H20-H5]